MKKLLLGLVLLPTLAFGQSLSIGAAQGITYKPGAGNGTAGSITSGTTTIDSGNDTSICFDNGGAIDCGDPDLTYDPATDTFTTSNITASEVDSTVFLAPHWGTFGEHTESIQTAPAVSNTSADSCGTDAATLVGTDSGGKVTVGATSGTSCTITFTEAWTNAPACVGNDETTVHAVKAISTTTTLILSGTFTAADKLSYVCLGYH